MACGLREDVGTPEGTQADAAASIWAVAGIVFVPDLACSPVPYMSSVKSSISSSWWRSAKASFGAAGSVI